MFNCAGYNIYKSDKRHRHPANHIACLKEITLFSKINMIELSLSSQYKQSIEKHNEAVTKQENFRSINYSSFFSGVPGLSILGT
jgi:hypothetical protein